MPRTHEPSDIVQAALADSAFPERLRHRVQDLVPVLGACGLARHLQLSCGDEQNQLLPEDLVTEPDARQSIAHAAATIAVARDVRSELFDG